MSHALTFRNLPSLAEITACVNIFFAEIFIFLALKAKRVDNDVLIASQAVLVPMEPGKVITIKSHGPLENQQIRAIPSP